MVSSRMAWDCGVADLAAGCCSGGRMPNAGARRALRSLAGASWSCRTDPLSRRPSSSIGNRLRKCVGKLAGAPKKAEPNTRTETRSAWRGRDRERERGSDGVLGRARQLRLPTMAAQGGLHLRVSWGREKREDERDAERYWALCFAELRPDARRERERLVEPTDRSIITCLSC